MSGYMSWTCNESTSTYVVQFVPEQYYDALCISMVSSGVTRKPVRIERLEFVLNTLRGMPGLLLNWETHPLPGAAVAFISNYICEFAHYPRCPGTPYEQKRELHVQWLVQCSREHHINVNVVRCIEHHHPDKRENNKSWEAWRNAMDAMKMDYPRYFGFLAHTVRKIDTKFRDVSIEDFRELQPLCEKIGIQYADYIEMSASEIALKAHAAGLTYEEARAIEDRLVGHKSPVAKAQEVLVSKLGKE